MFVCLFVYSRGGALAGREVPREVLSMRLLGILAVAAARAPVVADRLTGLSSFPEPVIAGRLKGSIGEGSNHSNFSHQSSVKKSVKIQLVEN